MPLATLPMGLQDASMPVAELAAAGAAWTRIITTPAADLAPVRDRIRDAHEAGLKVVLTIGGIGTSDPHPGVRATLRLVDRLPRADAYTWTNEPDLTAGTRHACAYGRSWLKLRRHLGRRLFFGDFSPYLGVRWVRAIVACGLRLPRVLDVAAHPYDHLDGVNPYSPRAGRGLPYAQMSMPHLKRATGQLRRLGLRVRWQLTEFGYQPADAWRWPLALHRARAAGARLLIVYTACGPTWCTRSTPTIGS